MVIKRSDGSWAPPSIRIPAEEHIGVKTRLIVRGIREHFGLQVTVLRRVAKDGDNYCVELEMRSDHADRKLQAVWVGSEEYQRFRRSDAGEEDVYSLWFRDAERPEIPAERLDWERKGWFQHASDWVEGELQGAGLQLKSPVEQYLALRPQSVLLRAETDQGLYYMKACSGAWPKEAVLSAALSERWPEWVPRPLSIEPRKNWLIMGDLSDPQAKPLDDDGFRVTTEGLAGMQIESMSELDSLEKMGCPNWGAEKLTLFLNDLDRMYPMLGTGFLALSSEELQQLGKAVNQLGRVVSSLEDFEIPNALVHTDFRPANLFPHTRGYWITDWSAAVVSHPFFSLFAKNPELAREETRERASQERAVRFADTYLARFEQFASPERLREALASVNKLTTVWQLMLWERLLGFLEPGTLQHEMLQGSIRGACRLIASSRDHENR